MDWIAIAAKIVEAYNQPKSAQKDEANILQIINHITSEINRVIDHLKSLKMTEFTGRVQGLQDKLREYKPKNDEQGINKTTLILLKDSSGDLLGEIISYAETGQDTEQNKALAALIFTTLFARAFILAEFKYTFETNMDDDIVKMIQDKMSIFDKLFGFHYLQKIAPIKKQHEEKNLPRPSLVVGIGPCGTATPYDLGGNYHRECDKAPELYDQIQSDQASISLYGEFKKQCINAIQRINGMKINLSEKKPDFFCNNHKFLPINNGLIQPDIKWVLGNDKNGTNNSPSIFWDFDNIAAGMQVTFQAVTKSEGVVNRLSQIAIWEIGENVNTNVSSGKAPSNTDWASPMISYKKVEELSIIRAEVYWYDQEEIFQIVDSKASWVQSSWT
ncbi:hypothetical protein PAECIP111891_03181 [Paenibacillus allorhizoplanae]|uniref:Uncharacterized protein n=1 Tax=Paenibacillus allorhizoplanae TaxID=2905648 RepID=A0ABN8GGB2_9BACL|nr:hypothetical protein [Paenibacillus allorhizoplanae]CAH1208239.1 hypothetical protein PAECIP111891_03181 [Paenibacillus allorhizoplanae]